MITPIVTDAQLRAAGEQGLDEFLAAIIAATKKAIGGELNASNMSELNNDQITLLAWDILHEEVMDGGFIQLIYNGYGRFIFKNPTARCFRDWGMRDLYKLLDKASKAYRDHHERIEQDMSDDDFMALFEELPVFDDFDDDFVENEEEWTAMVAYYVDEHLDNFVKVAQ